MAVAYQQRTDSASSTRESGCEAGWARAEGAVLSPNDHSSLSPPLLASHLTSDRRQTLIALIPSPHALREKAHPVRVARVDEEGCKSYRQESRRMGREELEDGDYDKSGGGEVEKKTVI